MVLSKKNKTTRDLRLDCKQEGAFILGASNAVQRETPIEHFLALTRAWQDHGIKKYLPLFQRLLGYPSKWLRNDLRAGLTTAVMVIPQSMAYATIAGLAALNPEPLRVIRRTPLGEKLGDERLFFNLDQAVETFQSPADDTT